MSEADGDGSVDQSEVRLTIDESHDSGSAAENLNRNKMPWINYLSPEELRGFKRYKYSSIDTSPLSNYVCHPFWNWLVQYVPQRIAPNTLTLSGFLLVVVNTVLLTNYDPDLTAASNPGSYIPRWVWLVVAFNHFWAHTLDGLDGKHARRTNTSSPLGELFDHGLDSWVTTLHALCIFSVFGRDHEFGVPTYRLYYVLWTLLILFSLSHWEKYNTGILYLPWGYDLSEVTGLLVYITTAMFGHGFWRFKLPLLRISAGVFFELSVYAGAILMTIPTSLRNIYRAYKSGTLKQRTVPEATRPLSTLLILCFTTLLWSENSPNNILYPSLRTFAWMTGVVSANMTCGLIITQMSSTIARWYHWLLTPVIVCTLLVVTIPGIGRWEFYLLYGLTVFVTLAHLHYGVSTVQQMAKFLNIHAFSVDKVPVVTVSPKERGGLSPLREESTEDDATDKTVLVNDK
ncbi:hypothetical protein RvY_07792 [Ramazzottius varieornatus]|uniref:Selenoprotein I n=1 Tax=Ramazzottius varieornatus TaxID=947166 RepID=A0A1D1V3P9_RAMVA|nr:hypothetical protein RvY_07792 [Ramazzottius varieornatus]